MVLNSSPIIRGRNQLPLAGTPAGDQARDDFIAGLLALLGDTRALWLPNRGDTTATTGVSREERTFTYDADIASRISPQGSGIQVDFDGDNDEADTLDEANLSFGDGTNDSPFSVLWVGNRDVDASAQTLISKQNSATVDEWELHLNTSGHPQFDLIDTSVSAIIGREDQTDIGTAAVFLAATYSGSTLVGGISIYKDAVVVDDNNSDATTGSYIAMEDTAALMTIGARFSTPERFYNGKMFLAAVTARELDAADLWAIKALVNAFYGLSL